MKLSALIRDLQGARVVGDAAREVRQVRDDSREVEPGDVFVAVRGIRVDGHDHLAAAVERGAAAVVVDHQVELAATQVVVADTTRALGVLAARAAGRPGDWLHLVGITGTNGKTTTTFLVEAIIAAAGARPGVIGTVSYRYGGDTHPAPYTTPTPLVLHRVLGDMAGARCTHAVLEVSSAALAMDRLAGVEFSVAAFTNLSQDHLEVHDTMDAYLAAKTLLFSRHLRPDGVAVINVDDPAAPAMIAAAGDRRVLRVSTAGDADVHVAAAESTITGIRAQIVTPRGQLTVTSHALLGAYNVANVAMSVAIIEALAMVAPSSAVDGTSATSRPIDHATVTRGVAAMSGVPGRVERVANDRGLDILVDYAHTPDALINVGAALRPLARRRLICVFGCGGDRDPSKRAKMGAAVASFADLAVVTSDNPRTEEPRAIIDMILPGIPDPFHVDVDRRVAIRAAVAEATPGDIVLIAGKGHEDYQILGTEKIHFDDREEAAHAVSLRPEFPLDAVVSEVDGRVIAGGESGDDARFGRVIIDGRIAAPGDLYVAIRGERHDGHAFCAQAVRAGARGLVVEAGRAGESIDLGDGATDVVVIEVDDGRRALGAIARWHRRRWGRRSNAADQRSARPLIAITGSAGKTTTKELLRAALSGAGRVHATAGSQNNETGVPLTLLGLRDHHEFAVIEMGMRAVGEIDYLTRFAEPTVSVVVNAGVAHVGVVGSVEDIARGKAEIFGHLPPDGVAVLPAGDPRLAEHARAAPRRITFGREPDADVRLVTYHPEPPGTDRPAGARLVLAAEGREHTLRLPLVGEHNATNAACAVAAALAAGVAVEVALAGLANAAPPSMRGEIVCVLGRRVLLDCYNANPAATSAALQALAEMRSAAGAPRALAVLGDMLELGAIAADAHREVGRVAGELGIDVVAVGDHRAALCAGAGERGAVADDVRAAAQMALARTEPGDWILVKASRGMRLERVLTEMRNLQTSEV